MTIKQTVNLMLKSSNHNPYKGMLSTGDNYITAIDLAKLCKEFADKGQADEAMNLSSEHWAETIKALEELRDNHVETAG
jgi:mitochondrial fission protein ELM1